ncbi:ankyrin repeat domain-containing protein [bacterium]|nr:ankyrin repeat domain-containing protein [bacterium]
MLTILEGQCRCGGVSFRLKPPYEYETLETCRKVQLLLAREQRFRLVVGEELVAGRGPWQLCSRCGTMLFYLHEDGRKFCLASTLERDDLLPSALHTAAQSDARRPKVLEFLQRGFDVEADVGGQNPLMCAARAGNIDSFRLLLDRGANPRRAVEAAAILAPKAVPLQRLLIEAGCDRQEMLSASAASSVIELPGVPVTR